MNLIDELKELVLKSCDLDDLPRDVVGPDDPLFGDASPLGLDSVDSLEIIVALQRDYGARIADRDNARKVLQSLRTLAEFVENNRK